MKRNSRRGLAKRRPLKPAAYGDLTVYQRLSPHFDERPTGMRVDTVVLHCMYLPQSAKRFDLEGCIAALERERVSAHFMISRRGKIVQLVPEEKRAWHAGVSRMPFATDQRENVNHFSVGIELIGEPEGNFTASQYGSLADLITAIAHKLPLRSVVGHDVIAPGRKVDPGHALDAERLRKMLQKRLPRKVQFFFS